MWDYLIAPFAWIMRTFYEVFNNYAVALIIYAIIVKVLLFPLSIKQHKNSLNMVRLKPYQDALQKKYGSNRERYNMELQKLYQREGYNPMSSCGPMLIQLPLIILIYNVVRHPLSYVAYGELFAKNAVSDVLDFATSIMNKLGNSFPAEIAKLVTEKSANITDYELQLVNMAKNNDIALPFNGNSFLGIDLSAIPSEVGFLSLVMLIPLISGITSYLVSWVSQKYSPMQMTNPNGQGGGKMMMYLMPLMSLFFTYTFNCALGLYWIIGNILSIGQTFLLNKMYDPKKILLEVEAKIEKEKTMKKEKRSAAAAKKAAAIAASKKKK